MFGSSDLRVHLYSKEGQIREVCEKLPEWKSVADNYYNHVYSLSPNYSSLKFLEVGSSLPFLGTSRESQLWILQTHFTIGENVVAWESSHDLANFLLSIMERGEIESNPFQTRALKIVLDPKFAPLRALKQLGAHVRWALLSDSTKFESGYEVITEIGWSLEQMPGLKKLEITFENDYECSGCESYSLPDLPHLSDLDFFATYDVEGALEPFIKYFNQITTLTMKSNDFWKMLKDEQCPKLLPKLERLSVVLDYGDDIINLGRMTSPLKEIEILCWESTSFQQCCDALQSFSETLVAAKIVVDEDGTLLDMEEPPTVHLPNLRVLSLKLKNKCGSLDGLMGLSSSVAYIKIQVNRGPGEPEDESGEIIKLWEERKDLYNSNVWSLMPALNEILLSEKTLDGTIAFSVLYTRAGYNERKERTKGAEFLPSN